MVGMTPTIFEMAEPAPRKRHARRAGKRKLKPPKRPLKPAHKTRRGKTGRAKDR